MGPIGIISAFVFLGTGGWLAARDLFRQPSGWPRTLAAMTLAWAWITIGLQILGAIGLLTGPAILGWAAAGVLAGGYRSIGMRVEASHPNTPEPWGIAATLALGLTLTTAFQLGALSFLLPPKIVSDGPIYHLFFAAKWWKAGSVFPIASPFGENAATYFPANGDLFFAGLMALFGGDRPAHIGQSPFLLMAGVAAYGIARRVGASAGSAVMAACLFVTSTPLFLFGFEANVDAIFVAGYVASVAFGMRYLLDGGDVRSLILAGLAAGAAWGTKPTATAFVPPLIAIGGAIILVRPIAWKLKLGHLAVLLIATLAPCGYWFGRSLLLTGNPLYPMHVELFGRVILRGWYPSSAMSKSQFYLPVNDWASCASIIFMVFDARLVPLWAAAICGVWMIGRRGTKLDSVALFLGALCIVNVATYWLAIPYRTQQRFMLQALGVAAAPLALLIDRWKPLKWVALALLAVHVTASQDWPLGGNGRRAPWEFSPKIPMAAAAPLQIPLSPATWMRYWQSPGGFEYLLSVVLLIAGAFASAGLWAWVARGPSFRRWLVALLFTAGMAGLITYTTDVVNRRPSQLTFPPFQEYQRGWAALEGISPRSGTRIAYAGNNLPYYLMSSGLRNDVMYVNIDAHPNWLLHDYHLTAKERGDPPLWDTPRPGWDRIHPDYDAWLANLRRQGIRFLVTAKANPVDGPFNIADREQFTIERVWADAHPETFTRVYPTSEPDREMRIYRIIDEKNPKSATDRAASPH